MKMLAQQFCLLWCGLQVSDFGLSRLVSNNTPIIETRTYGKRQAMDVCLQQLFKTPKWSLQQQS
jgi:hypothetical protein